jgi:hypothetical protein
MRSHYVFFWKANKTKIRPYDWITDATIGDYHLIYHSDQIRVILAYVLAALSALGRCAVLERRNA